jgi:putative solute:sodium symporter small subunit
VRAQLGLSLMCLTLALVVTASYPVVAALAPAITKITVAGLPLTLIVLGFGFYPVLLGIGWFYNHQARQLEARFTGLVDPAARPLPDSTDL